MAYLDETGLAYFWGKVKDHIYPVGSIYMSVSNTDPSTLFGGTWVAWGAGRVPVGVDTNDTAFDTVEETGGEKTHTLIVNEMPSHKHGFIAAVDPTGFGNGYVGASNKYTTIESSTSITNTGGGQAHNNLQPYITCYMWKRTA